MCRNRFQNIGIKKKVKNETKDRKNKNDGVSRLAKMDPRLLAIDRHPDAAKLTLPMNQGEREREKGKQIVHTRKTWATV